MGDALWIGVDFGKGEEAMPALSVFRKNGESFELVKTFSGEKALELYSILTKEGDDTLVAEVVL